MSKVYTVPTHLNTPQPVLSLGGISLSAPQFLWVLLGVALSYDCWQHLKLVVAHLPFGQYLGLAVALLPFTVSLVVAFVRIARRSLFAWLRVFLSFQLRPHYLVWRTIRFQEPHLSWLPAGADAHEAGTLRSTGLVKEVR